MTNGRTTDRNGSASCDEEPEGHRGRHAQDDEDRPPAVRGQVAHREAGEGDSRDLDPRALCRGGGRDTPHRDDDEDPKRPEAPRDQRQRSTRPTVSECGRAPAEVSGRQGERRASTTTGPMSRTGETPRRTVSIGATLVGSPVATASAGRWSGVIRRDDPVRDPSVRMSWFRPAGGRPRPRARSAFGHNAKEVRHGIHHRARGRRQGLRRRRPTRPRRGEPADRGRSHHRGHGAVGLRQIDAPQPRRGARPSDPGRGRASMASASTASARPRRPVSAGRMSASSSSSSTCSTI